MSKSDKRQSERLTASSAAKPDRCKWSWEFWPRRVALATSATSHDGHNLYINWRRGSKEISGVTKRSLAREGSVSWDEKFLFDASVDKKADGKYESKSLTLKLKEDGGKSGELDRLDLDLANFVNDNGSELHKATFPKTRHEITFRIKATLIRINDRKVVRELPKEEKDAAGGKVVSSGSKYFVTQTETHVSDPTVDTDSDVEDVEELPEVPSRRKISSRQNSANNSSARIAHGSGPERTESRAARSLARQNSANLEAKVEELETTVKGYEEHIASLEKTITQLRQQRLLKRKGQDEEEAEKGSTVSSPRSSDSEMLKLKAELAKLTVENNKLQAELSEMKGKAANALNAKDELAKLQQAVEEEKLKQRLPFLDVPRWEKELQATPGDPSKRQERFCGLLSSSVIDFLAVSPPLAPAGMVSLLSSSITFWRSHPIPSLLDQIRAILNSFLSSLDAEWKPHLGSIFLQPSPARLPRAALGSVSRSPYIGELLGRLADLLVLFTRASIPPSLALSFFRSIFALFKEMLLRHLITTAGAASLEGGINLKMTLSEVSEWLHLAQNKTLLPLNAEWAELSEVGTLLSVDVALWVSDAASFAPTLHPRLVLRLASSLRPEPAKTALDGLKKRADASPPWDLAQLPAMPVWADLATLLKL